jgi:hypothetical protein
VVVIVEEPAVVAGSAKGRLDCVQVHRGILVRGSLRRDSTERGEGTGTGTLGAQGFGTHGEGV